MPQAHHFVAILFI